MFIQYIGKKDFKTDTVNATGTVWAQGETKEYPDELGYKLLGHTDIWVQVNPQRVLDKADELMAKLNEKACAATIELTEINPEAPAELGAPSEAVVVTTLPPTESQEPAKESKFAGEKLESDDADLPTLSELLASLSTKKELQAFAKENNVPYANSMTEAQLRAKLLRDLGD